MNNTGMDKLQSEKLKHFPNVNTLMKISLGLILFTIISTAFVYAETLSVSVDGTSYDVEYTATGMTISAVEADLDFVSLIFTVDVTASPGTLDITFERSFFDSIFQGGDDDFIILADGDEPNFSEIETTPQSRTLSIDLPAGTEDVEIIGSVFGASVPVEDEPVEETPVEEAPKTQCGPGTILKNGECVLDERCGPGTILKNGECVLDPTSQPSSGIEINKGMGRQLVIGIVAAFVIAGIVGLILGIMSKASKSGN